jgi:trans-2,3-dihydro-3-hydroxyanthranilate isomerase
MARVDLGESVLRDLLIGINVYTLEGWLVRSRVFVPGPSVPEDAATGSAAVGLGVTLVASGNAAGEGVTSFEIVQGIELGRPSHLAGRVEAAAGVAIRCWVSGQVQPVGEGTIKVPPPES